MPKNELQKIVLLDVSATSQAQIETKLDEGCVIQFIVSLQPKYDKLLIVYSTPDII